MSLGKNIGRVSTFTLLENTFSYTSKDQFEKQIPLEYIPSGTGDPLKETKNMLEDKNGKQVRKSIGGPLKKDMLRDKKENQVGTYADVLSTGKLSNDREK